MTSAKLMALPAQERLVDAYVSALQRGLPLKILPNNNAHSGTARDAPYILDVAVERVPRVFTVFPNRENNFITTQPPHTT